MRRATQKTNEDFTPPWSLTLGRDVAPEGSYPGATGYARGAPLTGSKFKSTERRFQHILNGNGTDRFEFREITPPQRRGGSFFLPDTVTEPYRKRDEAEDDQWPDEVARTEARSLEGIDLKTLLSSKDKSSLMKLGASLRR